MENGWKSKIPSLVIIWYHSAVGMNSSIFACIWYVNRVYDAPNTYTHAPQKKFRKWIFYFTRVFITSVLSLQIRNTCVSTPIFKYFGRLFSNSSHLSYIFIRVPLLYHAQDSFFFLRSLIHLWNFFLVTAIGMSASFRINI